MSLYCPNLSALDVIAAAIQGGDTVTLTREQAAEVYRELEQIRANRADVHREVNGNG